MDRLPPIRRGRLGVERALPVCGTVFAVLFATAAPAYAYLDPGIASMVVQGIVAALAAVSSALFVLRAHVRRIFQAMLRPFSGKAGAARPPNSDAGKPND